MCNDHDDIPAHPALLTPEQAGMTRRTALRGLGLTGAGLGLGGALLGAVGLGGASAALDADEALAACSLTPELTEGPYYLDLRKIRRNITEGKPGLRLDLRIKVIDSSTCKPLKNIAVDIWHAAADGSYSGFAAEGTSGKTYMRGIQLTNADGIAVFRTIYPGWYQGRATHIHIKAHEGGTAGTTYKGGTTAHTGQLFFSDTLTDKVAKVSPYSSRTITRTRNATDGIYQQGGSSTVLKLTRRSSSNIRNGFTGRITLGIDV